jgi:hypothetical protein
MFCIFSWKKEYIKNCDAILLSKYDSAEKDTKLCLRVELEAPRSLYSLTWVHLGKFVFTIFHL